MKKMILSMMLLFATTVAFAQQPAPKKAFNPEEHCKAMTEALQHKLMLDEATAAWFAPLYKEYMGKLHEACGQHKQKAQCPTTDKEILKQMEDCLDRQEQVVKIKRNYFKKFQQKLTPRQVQVVMKQTCDKAGKKQASFGKKQGKFGKKQGQPGMPSAPFGPHHMQMKKDGKAPKCENATNCQPACDKK